MEIINVVCSTMDDGVCGVKSFPITDDLMREKIVETAEAFFINCILDITGETEMSYEDKNLAIEDGYYDTDNASVYLIWSE